MYMKSQIIKIKNKKKPYDIVIMSLLSICSHSSNRADRRYNYSIRTVVVTVAVASVGVLEDVFLEEGRSFAPYTTS